MNYEVVVNFGFGKNKKFILSPGNQTLGDLADQIVRKYPRTGLDMIWAHISGFCATFLYEEVSKETDVHRLDDGPRAENDERIPVKIQTQYHFILDALFYFFFFKTWRSFYLAVLQSHTLSDFRSSFAWLIFWLLILLSLVSTFFTFAKRILLSLKEKVHSFALFVGWRMLLAIFLLVLLLVISGDIYILWVLTKMNLEERNTRALVELDLEKKNARAPLDLEEIKFLVMNHLDGSLQGEKKEMMGLYTRFGFYVGKEHMKFERDLKKLIIFLVVHVVLTLCNAIYPIRYD